MKWIRLGNGLTVSEVALGAMNFGSTVSEKEAFRTLDVYLEMGGNFIDTSNNYAHWAGTGDESETLLGKWLQSRGCRNRVVLATKVGFDRHGSGAGLKKEQIAYWAEESLRKLRTDHIDLYYAHTDDPDTPVEETMEAFWRLVEAGKVRALGASNFDTWRVVEANNLTREKNWTPYTVMQQKFSYLNPRFGAMPHYRFNEPTNRERLRFLYEKNMPLVAYSCLCKGAYEDPRRLPEDYEGGERLERIRTLAADKGISASAAVIAWLANLYRYEGYPRIIPLFSASSKHLEENLKGLERGLTDDEMEELNRA